MPVTYNMTKIIILTYFFCIADYYNYTPSKITSMRMKVRMYQVIITAYCRTNKMSNWCPFVGLVLFHN